ncbi:MAG: sigma-70 family RNA polymerase sigma factor [Planctomycetota bacterium]|nr:MAG: sigma-70 family RNA polymerase sigma factor [Planctomycetota bacterium]
MAANKTSKKPVGEQRGQLRKLTPTALMPNGSALRSFSAEDVQRLRRRVTEPLECVYHPTFPRRNAERIYTEGLEQLLEETTLPPPNARPRDASRRRSLTAAQERELFMRFNYFRYRTMRTLKQFSGKRLTATAARDVLHWDRLAYRVRDQIANANLGLVPTMVERSRITGVDFSELISEGHLALLRSIDKFDCSRGFKFSTYACRAILTSITRAVALMARHRSRFPTEYDPDLQKGDVIEQRRAGFEEHCVEELQRILKANSAELSEVERSVLNDRFGLLERDRSGDEVMKTLRQVADNFGVTKERVRQIQNKALAKLRATLDVRVFPE